MIRGWAIALALPALMGAADLATYRGFTLGSDLATVAAKIGGKPSEATVLHERPALMQELKWQVRPVVIGGGEPARPDPVEGVVLGFLDGKLYRMAALYDRYKVKGMTVADLVAAMSPAFGVAEYPKANVAFHTYYGDTEKVLARWQDADVSYNLINTGDADSYALIIYSIKQEVLSQAAILEAGRLNLLDAPRREKEEEAKRLADEKVALEKVRGVNKGNFRP